MLGRRWLAAGLVVFVFAASGTARAAFTDIYFFGASWTDTGNNGPADVNLFDWASYNYDPDRWTNSNGTLWSEGLAAALGHSAAASASTDGGNNYAVAGSRADQLASQVAAFSTDVGGAAEPGALYVIWAGTNDLLQGQDATSTVNDLIGVFDSLYSLGARKFLVANLPDLSPLAPGSGPLAGAAPIPPGAGAWASDVNAGMASAVALAPSVYPGVTIYLFDAASLINALFADPAGNGFSAGLSLCVDDEDCRDDVGTGSFLMHDHLHFTSAGHQRIAEGAIAVALPPAIVPALQPSGRLTAFLLVSATSLFYLRRSRRCSSE
jgi:phospholipase/lecithinase/hemolysin